MGNPYLDGEQARNEFIKLQNKLKKRGYSFKLANGRNQVLDIEGKCKLIVIASPANTLFKKALPTRLKEYNDVPVYIVLTRDPKDYPDSSMSQYWSKIKKATSIRIKHYNGLVIGLDSLLAKIDDMIDGVKLDKPYENQIDFSLAAEKVIDMKKLNDYLKEEKVSKNVRDVIVTLLKL
jgi:hypothetical protein